MCRALVAVALLLLTSPALAQPAVSPEARGHLDRGEQLFGAGAWDAALAEYEAAYAAMAGHPSQYVALFNIAQCHERSARYDEALRAYQRHLDEGGARERDAGAVRERIRVLESLLGTLRVTLRWPGGAGGTAELWVSGRRVGSAPGEVRLTGGTHAIEVRARGYERASEAVTLTAGATRSVEIAMRALGGALDPSLFAAATAATLAALGLGVTLGSWALVRHDELASLATQALRTRADLAELAGIALGADVSFAIAGALAITSLVLFFLTDFSGGGAAASTALAPWLAPGAGGLALATELP